ncbi:MAG: recombinase family protein [Elusimicrobiales bacterium]
MDIGKITALKFPTFWFDPTPQGKFMLSIAFGQSKYYVDNLSENVHRGLRQKLRNGTWPGRAPLGYINDLETKTILPDKDRVEFVRKTFELYASGNYSLAELRHTMNAVGLKGPRQRGALSISNYQYVLQNPIYYGLMRFRGELYEGKHKPLITKALFDQCQEMFNRKSKPQPKKGKTMKPFVYRGAFRCASCGCFITTETQKGHNYLHCTKRKQSCSEPFVREEEVDKQIRGLLKGVSLPPALAAEALDNVNKEELEAAQAGARAAQNLRDKLVILTDQLGQLLDLVLQGSINQSEYVAKKAQLVNEKKEIENKLAAFARQGANRFEPLKRFYELCVDVGESAVSGGPADNLQKLKNIGSNLIIGGKKINLKLNFPAAETEKLHALPGFGSADFCNSVNWRPLRDSNP